jgi:hypothetical protein
MNNLKKMLKSRPFIDEVKWQMNALVDEKILNEDKVVLAAGTSSGKTFFTIMLLNLFYMIKSNKNKKTIIIPSAQTNLRSNFEDSIIDFNPDFKYVVCKTCDDLREAVDSDAQVIVCLPQTISMCIDILPKVEKLIVDEAHVWYYAKTVKSIIKKTKPKQQLLLTGTPSIFILKRGFHMHYVSVMDLYDEGRIAETEIHVVSSYYDFKDKDYNEDHNLNLTARAKARLADEASFKKVILGMMKKLKNPIKSLKNVNRLTNDVAGKFFKHLDKTIIWANSIKQADKFAEILRTFNGLENAVLVSHSKNDDDSSLMDKFKNDNDIRVLVSVNRGRMGWSYTELYNAIDFTMTRNPNSILQMMARLFRVSKVDSKKRKYFYKVSNSKDAGYYTVIMKGVLLLLDREWYSKFNGRNFNDMRIPVTVPRRTNPNRDGGCKTPGRKRTVYNYEMIDLPLDMNFFKSVLAKQDDMFSTVAWTSIAKVRQELGFTKLWYRSENDILEYIKKYKTYREFRENEYNTYTWVMKNPLIRSEVQKYFDYSKLNSNQILKKAKAIAQTFKPTDLKLFRKQYLAEMAYLRKHDKEWYNTYFTPSTTRSNNNPVAAYYTDGTLFGTFSSCHLARLVTGVGFVQIKKVINKELNSSKGFTFKYI